MGFHVRESIRKTGPFTLQLLSVPFAAVALISGCGRPHRVATSSEDDELPPGWTVVTAADQSVSIDLPQIWQVDSPPERNQPRDALQSSILTSNSRVNAMANEQLKLIFHRTAQIGEAYGPSGNVMVIASPSPMSLDGLAKSGQAALLASGLKPKLTHMLLPTAGEAELLRYDQPFKSPIGPLTLTHLCYMCLRGGKKYLLSFAFLPDDTESEIQAEQMATTWRLGRAPVAGSR